MCSGDWSATGVTVVVSPIHRGIGRARTSMNGELIMAAKKGARKGGKKAAKKGAKKGKRKSAKKARR